MCKEKDGHQDIKDDGACLTSDMRFDTCTFCGGNKIHGVCQNCSRRINESDEAYRSRLLGIAEQVNKNKMSMWDEHVRIIKAVKKQVSIAQKNAKDCVFSISHKVALDRALREAKKIIKQSGVK